MVATRFAIHHLTIQVKCRMFRSRVPIRMQELDGSALRRCQGRGARRRVIRWPHGDAELLGALRGTLVTGEGERGGAGVVIEGERIAEVMFEPAARPTSEPLPSARPTAFAPAS